MHPTSQNFRRSPSIPIPKVQIPPLSRTSGPLSERSENSPTPPDSHSLCELADFVNCLTLNRYEKDEKKIRKAIQALGQEFHGLEKVEIQRIVEKVVCELADQSKKGTYRASKKRNTLPRTLYFDYDKHVAYVFLKTKGNLPENKGGFRRGTRALRICWIPSSRNSQKPTTPKVERAFQLVSHDAKCDSETAHSEPFEHKIQKTLPDFDRIKDVFVRCHTFFQYEKIKKGTNVPIKKSCTISDCHPTSLDELIRENEVSNELAIGFAYDLLRSLKTLHIRGIVHGDIKPGNILVDSHGHAKLIDFDFATTPDETPRWQEGFYGTYTYSAPELLRKEALSRAGLVKTDIFALGVILYRIGFGGPPSWTNNLRTYKEFGSEQRLEEILDDINDLKRHCLSAKNTIGNGQDDKTFIQDLALLMMHPDPNKRISAEDAITEIGKIYTF